MENLLDYEIVVPEGTMYLGEFMKDLPDNCIFNKLVVGGGGTTVALTCDYNYVICVPFVSLIENKLAQHDNIFGVYKGVSMKDFKNYLNSDVPFKKIMVTYDSLPRLSKYINPSDYKLLVDEYHLLFNSYSFRKNAVRELLKTYKDYKSFCFMTATLLEREFLLKEVQDLPIVTAKWSSIQEVTVTSIKCDNDVIHTVTNLVNEYLNGEKSGNCYLFVNSVEFIKSLVKSCNLTDDNARAIWSANNKSQTGLTRGTPFSTAKKINLLTSTVFEGCDFQDEDAHIYIISDGKKAHTMIDISTSFQQIANRIRNSKYKDNITHIYQNTRYAVNIYYDEYKEKAVQEYTKNQNVVKQFPELTKDMQETWIRILTALEKAEHYDQYLVTNGDTIECDENTLKVDLYNFKVIKSIYKIRINLENEYRNQGYIVNSETSNANNVVIVNPKDSFKDIVLECQKGNPNTLMYHSKRYPYLLEAITKLGYEGIADCKYDTSNIKRKLINIVPMSDKSKIAACLKTSSYIYEGSFITAKQLNALFQKIYKDLNINEKTKTFEIDKYYYTKNTTKGVKINDKWTTVKGYTIIKEKHI